jgi:hypothetical protein
MASEVRVWLAPHSVTKNGVIEHHLLHECYQRPVTIARF